MKSLTIVHLLQRWWLRTTGSARFYSAAAWFYKGALKRNCINSRKKRSFVAVGALFSTLPSASGSTEENEGVRDSPGEKGASIKLLKVQGSPPGETFWEDVYV